jgi:poly-gamma-glutamate capsule biosynthesis protein CapA/YwtB (metallophosphatase superfamily)
MHPPAAIERPGKNHWCLARFLRVRYNVPAFPATGSAIPPGHTNQQSGGPRGAQTGIVGAQSTEEDRPHMRQTFSRRRLLIAASLASLAGCAPLAERPITPAKKTFALGRPAKLFADATVPQPLAGAALSLVGGRAGIPSVTTVNTIASQPDLILTFGALPPGYRGVAAGRSPLTAITDLRTPVEDVTAGQMISMLTQSASDWDSVGAPYSLPVQVHALAGLPFPRPLQPADSHLQVHTTLASLKRAVSRTPGSLALLPVDAVDWTVKNLGINGIYPAQGRGDLSQSAFAPFTLALGATQQLLEQGLDLNRLVEPLAQALSSSGPMLDMIAVGDIMLGRGVNNQMVAHNDYLYPYRRIRDELSTGDLRIANLECTITDLVPVPEDPYTFTFVSSKRAVDGLVYAGINALTVANNHSNGCGEPAFLDMLETLNSHHISVCGGGNTLAEARRPAILTAKGLRVALLGYDMIAPQGPFATSTSSGLAPVDLETLPADIAAARDLADVVIPYFHWGIEYTKDPTIDQQHVAHAAIDAGADMVLGNHPHWTQAIEEYRGKLIIYSFGNFIFDQDWSRPTMESMLIHFYWQKTTLCGIRLVPAIDENRCQPRVETPEEAVGVFERMWSGTDMLAQGEYGPEPE